MKQSMPLRLSWLERLGVGLVSALALIASFTIASLLLVVLLAVGLVVGGWLWWKLRRLLRQAQAAAPDIIEGEYTIVANPPALEDDRHHRP